MEVREKRRIHEIGHNLGLDHEDGSSIMDNVNATTRKVPDSIGKTETTYSYPKIDKSGIKKMIKKMNNNAEIIDKIIKEGREKAKGDMNGVLIKVNE